MRHKRRCDVRPVHSSKLIDLLELKNSYISGDELWASCPCPENHRHGDKKPSWSINLNTLRHHCFSCGFSGDAAGLVMRQRSCSRSQALRLLYGDLSFSEIQQLMAGSSYKPVTLTPLERDVEEWTRHDCPYWRERGFNDQTVAKWRLGYDPSMNRAVVPVFFGGKLVGWTARALTNDVFPKWLHSKDMAREIILFGYDNASQGDSCILVEAPLSAIMLDQYGFPNPVASFGCQLSDGQARLIRQKFDSVLVFYDPDEAGHAGTLRAMHMLEPFCKVFSVLPTRDDPAAMTKRECWEAVYGREVVPSWAYS